MNGVELPRELLARLSRPGPRYTSYPTANVFDASVGPDEHAAALRRHGESGAATSLYVHLPFCRSLCFYCACNVIITRRGGAASEYLTLLEREADLARAALGRAVPVTQLHLGGGTPTYLSIEELRRLHALLAARFDLGAAQELSVEVDPRVTTPAQLDALAALGWRRASFGVQDFDPAVQAAIHRVQSPAQTAALVDAARAAGFDGINIDLIHGLPLQRVDGFRATVETVLAMRPDRVALYSYAHVPWLRPAQASFERRGRRLPAPDEKLAIFEAAVEAFARAGYVRLGMDHFALPTDELARALEAGTLHRNFQGYTVRRADALVGLGVSSISDVGGLYAQSEKELEPYAAALAAGRLPTARGWRRTPDDERRRAVIATLMTGGDLPAEAFAGLALDRERLAALEGDGLIALLPDGALRVTPLGRMFVRNVAMAFDAHLAERPPTRPTFSQTV